MDKPLSKAAKLLHKQSNGCDVYESGCLYCHAPIEKQEYDDVYPVENGDIEQKVKCLACGRKWIDIFRLIDVREIV